MVDVVWISLALLVLGVVASVVPLVPGALASLAGIYLYWWHAGYTEPGIAFVVVATVVGLSALALDVFGGAISSKAGGASLRTAAFAAAAGVALLFTTGPIGAVLGVGAVVFLLEYREHRDGERGVRTALYTTVGMVASTVVQVLVTLSLLVGFVVVLLW